MNNGNLKIISTESEAREKGKKGGLASVEARRIRRELKEAFTILLEEELEDKQGKVLTGSEAIALQVFKKALKGDLRAFEIIRDTTEGKPKGKMELIRENNKELEELIEALKK